MHNQQRYNIMNKYSSSVFLTEVHCALLLLLQLPLRGAGEYATLFALPHNERQSWSWSWSFRGCAGGVCAAVCESACLGWGKSIEHFNNRSSQFQAKPSAINYATHRRSRERRHIDNFGLHAVRSLRRPPVERFVIHNSNYLWPRSLPLLRFWHSGRQWLPACQPACLLLDALDIWLKFKLCSRGQIRQEAGNSRSKQASDRTMRFTIDNIVEHFRLVNAAS